MRQVNQRKNTHTLCMPICKKWGSKNILRTRMCQCACVFVLLTIGLLLYFCYGKMLIFIMPPLCSCSCVCRILIKKVFFFLVNCWPNSNSKFSLCVTHWEMETQRDTVCIWMFGFPFKADNTFFNIKYSRCMCVRPYLSEWTFFSFLLSDNFVLDRVKRSVGNTINDFGYAIRYFGVVRFVVHIPQPQAFCFHVQYSIRLLLLLLRLLLILNFFARGVNMNLEHSLWLTHATTINTQSAAAATAIKVLLGNLATNSIAI